MSEQLSLIKNLVDAICRLEVGDKLSGGEMARLVKEITSLEIEEGGPYSIESGGGLDKADFGLNLLISYFLLLCEVDLPKLDVFLKDKLVNPSSTIIPPEELLELVRKWKARNGSGGVNASRGSQEIVYGEGEKRVMDLIMKKFDERFAGFSKETRERARKAIEKTILGNQDKQMSLMAYFTKIALGKRGAKISDDTVAEMGLANIFFWTAFIIYDDFWDEDEAADPKLLPIANVFARHYTDYFLNVLSNNTEFRSFFHERTDKLDAANAWETEFCRLKVQNGKVYIPDSLPKYDDYEKKFQPASGHIFGPVAELITMGYSLESPEIQNFISYFKNYLIAMQLNDDAHDWEEDLRRGHISTVVDLLLRDLKASGWDKPSIDLETDLPELQKLFWFTTMPKYIKLVIAHTNKARSALLGMKVFEDTKPLMQFVDRNENIARKAEQEQTDSEGFLSEYRNA